MKLTKFSELPGTSSIDKLSTWAAGSMIYTQIKYHGISARYIPGRGLFTRQGKQWDLARFPQEMVADLAAGKDFVLYGELVIPDMPFPEAAGKLNVNSDLPIPPTIRLHLFDAEHLTRPTSEQSFTWRLAQIQTFRPSQFIQSAPTYLHIEPIYADRRYDQAIERGHEGVVYRIDPALLSYPSHLPHPHIVKRKKLHSAEGICIGVEEGKGKRRGMAGALLLRLANGQTLKVGGGPGVTDELLTKFLARPPLNLPVTFTYEELSSLSIPLRPQLVTVRNYE